MTPASTTTTRLTGMAAAATTALLMTSAAHADIVGLTVSRPDFSGGYILADGSIAPASEFVVGPAWPAFDSTHDVYRVWATFDDPNTQVVSVGAGTTTDLQIESSGSFHNFGTNNQPPHPALAASIPVAAFDTFLAFGGLSAGDGFNLEDPNNDLGFLNGTVSSDAVIWGDRLLPGERIYSNPGGLGGNWRFLIGQFTVDEGESLALDLEIRTSTETAAGQVGTCCFEVFDIGSLAIFDCRVRGDANCRISFDTFGGTLLGGTPCRSRFVEVDDLHSSNDIARPGVCGPVPSEPTLPPCAPGQERLDPWLDTEIRVTFDTKAGTCDLPADFFGPGSDPFTGSVHLDSLYTGLGTMHPAGLPQPFDFGQTANMLLRRDGDPFESCDPIGAVPSAVPVRMDQYVADFPFPNLSVTYNGNQSSEEWFASISIPDPETQPWGTLTATKTHCDGGVFDMTVTLCPQIRFFGPGGQEVTLDYCADCDPNGITIEVQNEPWSHRRGPAKYVEQPICTEFVAGLETISQSGEPCPCFCPEDCAPEGGNAEVNVDDLFAVVNAISTQDLTCDVAPQRIDTGYGNNVVNFDDLIATINRFGPCQ